MSTQKPAIGTSEQWQQIADIFEVKWICSHARGALDSKHMIKKVPKGLWYTVLQLQMIFLNHTTVLRRRRLQVCNGQCWFEWKYVRRSTLQPFWTKDFNLVKRSLAGNKKFTPHLMIEYEAFQLRTWMKPYLFHAILQIKETKDKFINLFYFICW